MGACDRKQNAPSRTVYPACWRDVSLDGGEGGIRISSPEWGPATENKTRPHGQFTPRAGGTFPLMAGRAGFEYYPLNGGLRPKTKRALTDSLPRVLAGRFP